MFRPAGDLGGNVDAVELAGQDLAQVRDQRLAIVPLARYPLDDVVVSLGVEVAERKVLELPFELADAEAVSERSIDIKRLARDLAAFHLRQRIERAHVVEAVGQLDEDDPKVLRHRHHHLADVLRLLLLVGPVEMRANLVTPSTNPANPRPDPGPSFLALNLCVSHGSGG